jgi:hypothetical protein
VEALQIERKEAARDEGERAITARCGVSFAAGEQRQERECDHATEERYDGG